MRITSILIATIVISLAIATPAALAQPAASLKQEPAKQPDRSLVPSFPRPTAKEAQILSALEEPATINAENQSLEEILQGFNKTHHVEIWVSKPDLIDLDVDLDHKITMELNEVPLCKCLKLLLQPLGLEYVIEDEMLKIIAPDDEQAKARTRIYPVHDLLRDANKSILRSIECASGIEPHENHESNQDFIPRPLAISSGLKTLTARVSNSKHELIVHALRGIREAQAYQAARRKPDENPDSFPIFPLPSETEARIQRTLNDPTRVDWSDRPLSKALADLGTRHRFNIWIDTKALDEEGRETDIEVSLKAELPLHQCLRQLLEPLGLVYLVEDDVLKITSANRLAEVKVTRIYSIDGFFAIPPPSDEFLRTVECGMGDLHGIECYAVSFALKTLVVRDTYNRQEEVKQLLQSLRQAQQSLPE